MVSKQKNEVEEANGAPYVTENPPLKQSGGLLTQCRH